MISYDFPFRVCNYFVDSFSLYLYSVLLLDCIDDLICFQREASEAVPGCNGNGRRSYDYCIINPILGGERPLTTTTTVTTGSSGVAVGSAYYLMIITFNTNTENGGSLLQPLGACQGCVLVLGSNAVFLHFLC